MSIAVAARVWSSSKTTIPSHRLMLLAIADFADDKGEAWPSLSTLATRCCVSERSANRIIAALCESGDLERRIGAGPKGTNVFRVLVRPGVAAAVDSLTPDASVTPVADVTPVASVTPDMADTLTPASGGDDTSDRNPLTPTSPEPSLNRQEPSAVSATPTVPCPYDQIVALYHEHLPNLPRVKLMDDGRRKAMRNFWAFVLTSKRSDGLRRATNADEALAWIGDYFQRATLNDFLMGKTQRRREHQNWKADFDFLLTANGRKHVIERTEDAA